ncbi:hypothetical protein ACDX78_03900 [Virgibacillus oceani]
MYRWIAVLLVASGGALAGCGASQQENTEEAAAAADSAVASISMAKTSQQDEREKEKIVLEKEVTVTDDKSDRPEEDQGTANEDEGIESASEKAAEDQAEETKANSEEFTEEETKNNTEKDTATEENIEAKAPAEKEKSEESKEQELTHDNRGNFAVDGTPGQTTENSIGIFTIEKAASAGTVSVGPINIEIENVSLVSGEVTDEATAGISGDEVRYLQMDAILQNTSEIPIQFFFAATTINVNGHQLNAHDMFSGRTDGDYTSSIPKNATLVYMLNENHPPSEQISNLTINISSPPINMETESEIDNGTSVDVSL